MKNRLIILGAGESGVGAAILAKQQGFHVFVSDGGAIGAEFKNELAFHEIEFEEQGHSFEKIRGTETVVKSPGIPEKAAVVKAVREAGAEVISEIEFAYRYKGHSKILAITGSNGKTTTTVMLFQICRKAGLDCAMVGNIGTSFARQVAIDPKPYYVVEISSFQLDGIVHFRPDVSVLTNITEDHLDRYDYRFENYIRSKFMILKNQTKEDVFIYNADDEVTMKYLHTFSNGVKQLPISMRRKLPEGAYLRDERMHLKYKEEAIEMSIEDFALGGKHNQYNSMAAALAAVVIGIKKPSVREALIAMESLEHRMQAIAIIRGVEYINDSKATNTNSTWYALESMEKPVVLILGGVDKGNDYRIIEDLVQEKVKAIVCLGKENGKIHEAFGGKVSRIVDTGSVVEAVLVASQLAVKGDVVLLSPACASFDLFNNYEDRGNQFSAAVKDL